MRHNPPAGAIVSCCAAHLAPLSFLCALPPLSIDIGLRDLPFIERAFESGPDARG